MKKVGRKIIIFSFLIVLAAAFAWAVYGKIQEKAETGDRKTGARSAPVEVAPIQRGPIEWRRTFSGALEATDRLVVAPKVSGRIERLAVDFADPVQRGQIVVELDNGEYVQAVAQGKAELAVAKANLVEASNALEIARRELNRTKKLRERGVASEARLDEAQANQLARQSQQVVAGAQVTRAEAALETARIRLSYTKIHAEWSGGDDARVVAERFIDEGETVSANTPLLSIIELDPITGVIFVTEREYSRLRAGQAVTLTTDGYPGEEFAGRIERIAPVFREATRQARVEVTVKNPDSRLKPGMFIRADIILDRVADAVIIPEAALTRRGDTTGIFLVNNDGRTVSWHSVKVGIREGERVQILGEELSGQVVTLGQQLVDDGSEITIPAEQEKTSARAEKAASR